MKRHLLLTTVSVLAIPFVVLTGSTPAMADDDGCAGMNFFQCQISRTVYAVEHVGQSDKPAAKLTTAPVTSPSTEKLATAPTMDQLNSAATKINDLAITGIITADQAAQALKLVAAGGGNLVAAGGGNLVAAGGGNLVAAGGGNVVSNDGGSIVAANALALAGASAQKAQIAASLVSDGGSGLRAASQVVQQNMIAGFQDAGKITDTQAMALSKLVAAGGGNLVAAGGGNLVAAGGGNLVAAGGGNLVAAGGGNLVAAGGGNLVAAGGGNLVAAGGGNFSLTGAAASLVAAGGGNLAAVSSLISEHGAGLVSAAALSQRSLSDVGGADKGVKVAALIQSVTGPTPAQLAAQKALTDTNNAATSFVSASDLVKRDGLALQNAKLGTDQSLINQLQTKMDADSVAMLNAGGVMMDKSKLVAASDVGTVSKLLSDTVNTVGTNASAGAAAANAGKPAPSQLQIDTANAAASTADAAAKKAADANAAVLALTATLGNRPTNAADLLKVNEAMASSAVDTAKANLAKAQSDLVTMSKNGASAYDIKGQQDLVTKAQTNVTYQTSMVANDYAAKAIAVTTASADLATAKSVVDGLTKAYGGNRPSDPTQLATINAAMVVQALAQDKADQTAADATRVRLIANGASASDIKTQADLVAVKQQDMANILKVNPTIVAAAGAAVTTDPALVAKALTTLVSAAATQAGSAVQLTSAQAAAALAALQQLKSGSATTAASTSTSAVVADVTAKLNTLTKSASTYSIQSLSGPNATNPAATTTATQVVSTSPAGTAANPTATQVVNPATTSLATSATTAAATTTAPVAAVVDKSEMTPAVVQMLLSSGSSVITAMQSAQQAALAKGDKATADGLGKDIVNLQAQIAVAKTMPPPAATTTTAAAATTTINPATTANPAATTAPLTAAATNPTSPATGAGSSATAASGTTITTTAAKVTDTQPPTKITREQGKAVQQALRTVPGNLTKTEEKNLSSLSALVDRAATKGLTPDEAVQLKNGLAALAEKHPKAEKQIGLTKIANSVAVNKPTASDAATKPVTMAPAENKVAVTTPATSTVPTPAMPGAARPGAKVATPTVVQPQVTTKPELPKPTVATTTPTITPVRPSVTHEMRPEPPKQAMPARILRSAPPVVTAPRPPVTAAATPAPIKPAVMPAPKALSCTPNMVNGKAIGTTCH